MSDTENKQAKKSKINEEVLRIADIVEADIDLVDKNGTKRYETGDNKTFEKTLPEGQTIEMYDSVFGHLENFAAGTNLALGRKATKDIAAGNFNEKDGRQFLDINIHISGKNELNGTYTKEVTTTTVNPQNKEEKITTTKHGVTRISLDMNATQNRGQLKLVRAEVNDMADAAFAALNK